MRGPAGESLPVVEFDSTEFYTGGGCMLEELRAIGPFAHLTDAALAEVSQYVRRREFPRGHIIYREGDPADSLYFVLDGLIKISRLSFDGREKVLEFLSPGQIFGCGVALLDPSPFSCTAEALTTSQIGSILRIDYENILHRHGSLAVGTLTILGQRLKCFENQIEELSTLDAPHRLAKFLMQLGEEYGQPVADGVMIDVPLTQQLMASYLGTSRETVTRMLAQFKQTGALRLDQGTIVITDPEALETFSL